MRIVLTAACLALVVLYVFGCAHHSQPYTVEYSVGDWVGDFWGDRGPSVLVVNNPDVFAQDITVDCLTGDGRTDRFIANDVPAGGSYSFVFQKLAKNASVSMCSAVRWEKT